MSTFRNDPDHPILERCEFQNGKLVKVDGVRHNYMDGDSLIRLVGMLAEALNKKGVIAMGDKSAYESAIKAQDENRLNREMLNFFERWSPAHGPAAAEFHAQFHSITRAIYADMQRPVTACMKSVLMAAPIPTQIIFPQEVKS